MKKIIPALLIMLIFIGSAPVKADVVTDWNETALQAIRDAATAPPVASRVLAITHAAIFDSVNSIYSTYTPYYEKLPGYSSASPEAAAAWAGYTALTSLFGSNQKFVDQREASLLAASGTAAQKALGETLGTTIANNLLGWRAGDGASVAQYPYTPIPGVGNWQPTPTAYADYLLPGWGSVTPFTMTSNTQFQQPDPPAPNSPIPSEAQKYVEAFNRVKDLGAATGSSRTDYQTNTAFFWLDGPGTATPPGHWNVIAQEVIASEGGTLMENARTFALLNLALGDAAIAAWDMKLGYHYWRPVTAIQAADDGNPNTAQDPNWLPLVETPPFASYVSGHSTFSGAAAKILAELFGEDTTFTDISEYPFADPADKERIFLNFTEAMEDAGISRIYGGIHWDFDNIYGLEAGQALGEYVFDTYLLAPLPGTLVMSLSGLLGIFLAGRRRMK